MARLGDDGVVEGWDKGDPPAGVEAGDASGDASEGLPSSILGRGEILRGLVGDPGRLELGVRSTKSSGRLDAVAERVPGTKLFRRSAATRTLRSASSTRSAASVRVSKFAMSVVISIALVLVMPTTLARIGR